MLHDAGGGFPRRVAVSLVNPHQNVEHISQYVAAALAGIDSEDVLRLQRSILLPNLRQLRLYLWFLLGFVQIILPARLQLVVRMALQPQPAQGVLHHIADDPVRREKLRRGGDIFLGDLDVLFQVGEHLILRLRVVILVQPADDLHLIRPVLLGDHGDHLLHDAAFPEKVVREEKLGVVGNPLEHPRQDAGERVALDDDHVLEQGVVIVGVLQIIDLLHVQAVQLHVDGLGQNLRLEAVLVIREHTDAAGQIAVDLHEAQGGEAVEPGIGDLLHDLFIALFPDPRDQGGALLPLLGGKDTAMHAGGVLIPVAVSGDFV